MAPLQSRSPGLIINADDLGIHPNINAGIISAYRKGTLSSCTMLVTTPYLEETVRDFVRPALLPIGIHLSLTLGKSIAPLAKVHDLVDELRNFRASAGKLICSKLTQNSSLMTQIRCELESQLALACDYGLRATHVDSHQHVHMNPAIFSLLEEILPRYGIHRLRYCREEIALSSVATDPLLLVRRFNFAKWALLRWRSGQLKPSLAGNDNFVGILGSGAMTNALLLAAISNAASSSVTEICTHPGYPAPANAIIYPQPNYNDFIASPARQREHDALLDAEIENMIRKRKLLLRAFDGTPKLVH
jgi:predicted glycoside hydrolase/deacetylase ChbG (UPF0249 family)